MSKAGVGHGRSAEGAPPAVCMLVTDFDAATGGLQKTSRFLLRGLNGRGGRTYVLARNYHNRPRNEVEDGTVVHRSPVLSRVLPALNSLVYLADALWWLVRNRRHYDVIHCQQMYGPAMVGLIAKKLLRKPVSVGLHMSGETLGEVAIAQRLPLARLRLRQYRGVDRWVALSSEMEREIHTLGVAAKQVTVIPNGTVLPSVAAFDAETRRRHRAALGLAHPKIAVFSGRLSWEKGLDVLLRAWKLVAERHPQAHLLILGEGVPHRNVEPELRALHRSLGLEEVVHFLGHVSNVGDYLLASDAYVLPTRSEGLSCALVEAMAAGTAIVTTNIPANLDIVQDEATGLLVNTDDPEALAAALGRIFDDPQLGERLGRAARQKAERDLSVESMTSQYAGLYSSIVAPE
ncbi:MAG: glycosyltransferase family 4 protein [Gemmatimonadetes bacterium]|nr:glycosyltransferase family 4 protein [Gemmatimonadota bacterium]